MSLLIHSNGIVEEILAKNLTLTETELTESFKGYKSLKSFRLPDVLNTWCLWGVVDMPPENEYNRLASEIVEDEVYSPLMLIHDSELNPDWKITDDILSKTYTEFAGDIASFIDEMVEVISTATKEEIEASEDQTSMIFLTAKGHTEDKKVLFAFNPSEQTETFYSDGGFDKFSLKIYSYLEENFYKEKHPDNQEFEVFADNKTIVIIEHAHVDKFIEHALESFEQHENYEAMASLTKIQQDWKKRLTIEVPPKKRRGRPPKKKD